jgi:hypothetical protein
MSASRVSDHRDLAVERIDEPIVAWRSWALTGKGDGSNLFLRPVARRSRAWRPREPAEASCRVSHFHHAPEPGCTCGLHASQTLDILRRTRCPAVLGRVALWGRVIEHELGYRARFAYPQRVRLICQFCFWQWGPLRARPTVVGWFPHDELAPLCEEHLGTADRNGMTARRLLPADDIEQRLRERYVVDLLAV